MGQRNKAATGDGSRVPLMPPSGFKMSIYHFLQLKFKELYKGLQGGLTMDQNPRTPPSKTQKKTAE